MCGIIGYSGSNTNAVEVLLEGLEKVEYRGYDSAGIAFVTDSGIQIEKIVLYKLNRQKVKIRI